MSRSLAREYGCSKKAGYCCIKIRQNIYIKLSFSLCFRCKYLRVIVKLLRFKFVCSSELVELIVNCDRTFSVSRPSTRLLSV